MRLAARLAASLHGPGRYASRHRGCAARNGAAQTAAGRAAGGACLGDAALAGAAPVLFSTVIAAGAPSSQCRGCNGCAAAVSPAAELGVVSAAEQQREQRIIAAAAAACQPASGTPAAGTHGRRAVRAAPACNNSVGCGKQAAANSDRHLPFTCRRLTTAAAAAQPGAETSWRWQRAACAGAG